LIFAQNQSGAGFGPGHSRHFGCVPVTSDLPPTSDMTLHRAN
jgi:hypothetical protein